MSRFHGPQPGTKYRGNKGVLRADKDQKRREAEDRKEKSDKENSGSKDDENN